MVGLSEIFDDDERARVRSSLADLYPPVRSREGPDERDFTEDGGLLLLLSRHPIVASHSTIYRQAVGADVVANKGALHVRIQPAGHPTAYDVVLTHTQNPNEGGPEAARSVVRQQLDHLASFVAACTDPTRPCLIMGDLNTDALDNARTGDAPPTPGLHADLLRRLGNPDDIWQRHGDTRSSLYGITSDDLGLFGSHATRTSDHPDRGVNGTRIDVVLARPGSSWMAEFESCRVEVVRTPGGQDISDHYGVAAVQRGVGKVDWTPSDVPAAIHAAVERVHCLTSTTGSGSWEPVAARGADRALLPDERNHRGRPPSQHHDTGGDPRHRPAVPLSGREQRRPARDQSADAQRQRARTRPAR